MSLPFFLLALLPALAAPVLTYRAAGAAYDWQRRQILLDNAAIALGESDLELARALIAGNRRLAQIEIEHHAAHECAHAAMAAAPQCVAMDATLEAVIVAQHELMHARALASWEKNGAGAAIYLSRHQVAAEVARVGTPPLHATRCPICQLAVYWERDTAFRSALVSAGEPELGTAVAVEGATLRAGTGWNYQLEKVR